MLRLIANQDDQMLQTVMAKMSLRHPWLAAPLLLFCGGCNLFAETTAPMPLKIFGDPQKADRTVVLMPGIRDRADDFIDYGFLSDARALIDQGRLALILADAHVGYYRERSVTERLQADILDRWPDQQFVLAGISLGGFGALTLARRHPDRIESLQLFAPFLGEKPFLKRVKGSPPEPRPDDEPLHQELVEIWLFLLASDRPAASLSYGKNDSFRMHYQALIDLGAHIPVHTVDGGHDWHAWRQLWQQWLDSAHDR